MRNSGFPTTPERSRLMGKVKSEGDRPELLLRHLLGGMGVSCVPNDRSLPGSPDAALWEWKVAVFVDGDFWHGRLWFEGGRAPKSNRAAWVAKFERNRVRDRLVDLLLLSMGWTPVRIWESDLLRFSR